MRKIYATTINDSDIVRSYIVGMLDSIRRGLLRKTRHIVSRNVYFYGKPYFPYSFEIPRKRTSKKEKGKLRMRAKRLYFDTENGGKRNFATSLDSRSRSKPKHVQPYIVKPTSAPVSRDRRSSVGLKKFRIEAILRSRTVH